MNVLERAAAAFRRGRNVLGEVLTSPQAQAMMAVGDYGMAMPGALRQAHEAGTRAATYAYGGDPYGGDDTALTRDVVDALGLLYGGSAFGSAPKGALRTFGGRNARTADHGALARAEQMASEGLDRRAIWDETGWFQGADGKWRFEIDDSGARLSAYATDRLTGDEGSAVGLQRSLMRHPQLYDAYPDVGRIPSKFDSHYNTSGAYRIDPQEQITAQGPGTGNVRDINLHETQHAVQRREGFARGGNPGSSADEFLNSVNQSLSAKSREMDRLRTAMRGMTGPERAPLEADLARLSDEYGELMQARSRGASPEARRDLYNRTAGEVEARNVQTRRDFTPEQRRATPPWETQDVPDAEQIVRFGGGQQASILEIEDYLARERMARRQAVNALSPLDFW